jgi:OOP family OmpA-OmpF porin
MTGLRPLAIALAALFLGACAQELTTLQETTPKGSEFTRHLTREYLSFAQFEADKMIDWPDARHFAAKGLQTAAENPVEPENPEKWNLPEQEAQSLIEARRRLVQALHNGAGKRLPKVAAVAQARFDCWVEQQQENWQRHHIAACRKGFQAAMEKLDKAASHTVYFAFDSAHLDAANLDLLAALAREARKVQANLDVAGHADRAGSEAHNSRLSKRRAAAVGAVLNGLGIPRPRLALSAHGESRPRIATPDGTREAGNRRVEITVAPQPPQPNHVDDDRFAPVGQLLAAAN